jgi:hypothetical protein
VDDPDTGKRVDLTLAEHRAFWSWAVVEVLRHTGIRVEELTELSHHSLVQYRLTNTLAITPPRPTKHHQALPHHANLAVIADNRWPPQSRVHPEK